MVREVTGVYELIAGVGPQPWRRRIPTDSEGFELEGPYNQRWRRFQRSSGFYP
jgi:hypothetical protein